VSDKNIIIIKKVSGHGHGHHGGAWKVAYADFVTAMMAFFLVMWIVGQSPQTKAAVAQYFRDPGVFETGRGGILEGTNGTPQQLPTPSDGNGQAALIAAESQLKSALSAMPGFEKIAERISIEMTTEGLRIELLDRASDSFFDSGSADLKPQMVEILEIIGRELGHGPFKVAIDGHSDGRKYKSGEFYDNWTLSADRANVARRVLEWAGLQAGQVDAVRGYADSRHRHPDDPMDPRNRRIAIVVKQGSAGLQASAADAAHAASPAAPAATSQPNREGNSGNSVH
jgi:chemotaxis protein MotB